VSAQVAADLRAAAEVLRSGGWCQRAYKDHGAHCLVGALDEVYMDRSDEAAEWAAYALLETVVGTPVLTTWNDKPWRTADEVIAALEAAADAAEADQ
jgi:hypothetical protein